MVENFLISYKTSLHIKIAEHTKSIDAAEELINYMNVHHDLKEDEIVDLISKKLNRNISYIFKNINVSNDSTSSSKVYCRYSSNEELIKRLSFMKDKIERRIHLDLEPEVFNPEYARGFYFPFVRWQEIKESKLYENLPKILEEIEEKIAILELLIKEEGDASLTELHSIEEFIDTLEKDETYFLSSKTIRKFARHPQLHKKKDFWQV